MNQSCPGSLEGCSSSAIALTTQQPGTGRPGVSWTARSDVDIGRPRGLSSRTPGLGAGGLGRSRRDEEDLYHSKVTGTHGR
jgi:hypothetical protein